MRQRPSSNKTGDITPTSFREDMEGGSIVLVQHKTALAPQDVLQDKMLYMFWRPKGDFSPSRSTVDRVSIPDVA